MDAKTVEEVEEYFALGAEVRPGDVVFDVGANVGIFAERVSRRCDGDVSLHCFEPIPQIFEKLEVRFRDPSLKKTRHNLVNAGLTSSPDRRRARFSYFRRLPTDSTYDLDAKREQFEAWFAALGGKVRKRCESAGSVGGAVGRVLERVIAEAPKGPVGRYASDLVTGRTEIECKLTTLDEFVEEHGVDEIDLMKIDVEGAELDVLRGGAGKALRKVRQIVLEGHSSEGRLDTVKDLLSSQGLEIEVVTQPAGAAEQGLDNYLLLARRNGAAKD